MTMEPESTRPDAEAPADEEASARVKRAVECVLLVAGGPVTPEQLQDALGAQAEPVREALEELIADYAGSGLQIQHVAGGYQLCTRPEFSEYVQRFLRLDHREPLSPPQLETLAIIAYRQPATRAEIEAVRGVRCDYVLDRLLERHLIRELGRKPSLGRPILYGTTEGFLRHFGLRDLSALPPLRGDDPRAAFTGPPTAPADGDSGVR